MAKVLIQTMLTMNSVNLNEFVNLQRRNSARPVHCNRKNFFTAIAATHKVPKALNEEGSQRKITTDAN